MNSLILSLRGFISRYKIYFKSSFLYLFPSIFTSIVGIAINPLMAKNLSHEDYAIMGYFNSFSLIFLPILNFSLISYYLRHYYIVPENRRQIISDTILIALLVYSFVALVILCAVFYFYWQVSKISFAFFPYALLTFAPIYFGNFFTLFQIKCRLKREAAKYSKIVIFSAILNTIFAIFFVIIYKYGATGRLLATLLASAITGVYCFVTMFGKFQFDWKIIRDAFNFGWPLSLSAILWYFLSGIDSAMLVKLNDIQTFGLYSVGASMAGYFFIFYTAIAQTFEPDIYKAIAQNERRKLGKILGGIITLNAIPNILFIMFAPTIIGVLTYNRYVDSSNFARIFALKNIVLSLYYCFISVVVGYGFTKSQLFLLIAGSIVSFFIYKVLIANFGFYGAAWGQVSCFLFLSLVVVLYLFYKFKFLKQNEYLSKN